MKDENAVKASLDYTDFQQTTDSTDYTDEFVNATFDIVAPLKKGVWGQTGKAAQKHRFPSFEVYLWRDALLHHAPYITD